MAETPKKEATRERYGKTLAKLAAMDRNVVALDCDLGRSTHSFDIVSVDPTRFFEMGIAEQDMISTAAGMATMGKIVFANSFAIFITGHAFDQIRQQVALPRSNVKLCGSSAGLTIGADGSTHQAIVDVALMRVLPGMTVLVPADGNQTEQVINAAYEYKGPVYIRLSRYETGDILPLSLPFRIGEAQMLKEGREVVLASYGPVLQNVVIASELLAQKGIDVGVVNFHTLKPIDRAMVERLAGLYRYIVSIEEHSIYGGLGSALGECISECPNSGPKAVLHRIGLQDTFGETGTADELLKKHGMDPEGITNSVLGLVRGPM
ncbi:MAG: transketolase C-terminal domain-containing protein [Rectinemataceae bacterium]|jgi:transketolase